MTISVLIPPVQTISSPIPLTDLVLLHRSLQPQLEAVLQAAMIQGDYVLGGALLDFEIAFARACDSDHGVGVGSGTDAITLGLRACGIGQGDEVLLPANTFVATLIGVLQAGATPVLVDCDPDTALIDLVAAEKAITPRTRAIIPVHLYGQMVSPRQLLDLSSTYDLMVFEDAAQAHLAEREGYRAGSVGIAAAFSFYPSKNLGALGDGGMVVTREAQIAERLRSLRNYGAPCKHYHTEFGVNSRLDTLQAAVLGVKLPHLPHWNRDRLRVAQRYDKLLAPLQFAGIQPITNVSGSGHAYHLYVVRITDTCPLERGALQAALECRRISTGIHYPVPCHLQPAFRFLGYQLGDFPNAERLSHQVLSLPIYPGMTDAQIQRVVGAIEAAVSAPFSVSC
ncbi:DegT/DnrJ/EryC1/StrS family aminotransferase [Thermoleptolyngbya sp.]|jgi:dTDP-4-amino-4,6-dideoxygalactose transaminase